MDICEATKKFLDGEGFKYVEDTLDNGDRLLRIPQKIQNGGTVSVILLFGEHKIKVAILGIATVEDEAKQAECYKLFNDFNRDYAFFKMYTRPDGLVCLDADFSLDLIQGEFQPKELVAFTAMAMHAVGKIYPGVMKIQWS